MALIWHGKKVTKAIHADARAKVLKAILLMEADVKMSMRKGGRTESGVLEGKGKNRKDPMTGKKAKRIGSYVSKPGEPPRVQSTTLRRSIFHDMHSFLPIGIVGVGKEAPYGKWLEFGTRRMKPRPFMRPSILRIMPALKGIFATPVKGGFMP